LIQTANLIRPTTHWRDVLLAASAALALVAVACGSDDPEPTDVGAPATNSALTATGAATADGDAMMDDDAKTSDGDAMMADDAKMADDDAMMTDDAKMSDGDAMMADDAKMADDDAIMTDDAKMSDGDAMMDDGDAKMSDGDAMMDDGDAMMSDDDAMMDDGSAVSSNIQGFQLQTLTVSVGDTVTWTNHDSAPHTVSHGTSPAVDGSPEFQSETFSKDGTFAHTFNTVGAFAYFCELHPSMVGTVTVQSGPASANMSEASVEPGY